MIVRLSTIILRLILYSSTSLFNFINFIIRVQLNNAFNMNEIMVYRLWQKFTTFCR
jgi:hypothetical protein